MTANAPSELWSQLVGEFVRGDEASQAWNAFFEEGVDRVGLVREALNMPGGNHRAAAVALLRKMSSGELQRLFPELVQLALAVHGPLAAVRKILAALPRNWVLARIDALVEDTLRGEQYDDYWMFLDLLDELDRDRAASLARRAANSADPDIRELGMERLASLPEHQ
jgi:hypothetical protein